MEDLLIAPWQNQVSTDPTDFYSNCNKLPFRITNNSVFQSKSIQTELDDQSECFLQKKKLNLQLKRKKVESTLQSQNFHQRKDCRVPSRIEIKLFSYPIQEKIKQKESVFRFCDKLKAIPKQRLSNQFFEVNHSIQSLNLKKVKVLKEKNCLKHHTYCEQNFSSRFTTKQSNKENYLLNLRNSREQCYRNQNNRQFEMNHRRLSKLQMEFEKKCNITNENDIQGGKIANRKKLLKHYFSHNDHQSKRFDHSFDVNQSQRFSFKEKFCIETNNQRKSLQKQRKISVQKLQNINCFKDSRNVPKKLKKKNKKLFNQLQRYNLFGLRKVNEKSNKD